MFVGGAVLLMFRRSLSGATRRRRSTPLLSINSLFKTGNSARLVVEPLVDALQVLALGRQGHNSPGKERHNFKNGPDHGNADVIHACLLQIVNLHEAEDGRRQAVGQ